MFFCNLEPTKQVNILMSANDFNISIEKVSDTGTIKVNLTGELTIENSSVIHNFLLNKVLHLESVELHISDVSNIDLSFLQLIIGFITTRRQDNIVTNIEFNLEESQIELQNKAGITDLISLLQKKEAI